MTARDNITRARARTPGVGVVIPLHGGARSNPRPDTARDNRWITRCTKGGSRLKRAWKSGRRHLKSLPSSRTGENPPYGMIGGIEETSASCEARYAPRSYPTRAINHPTEYAKMNFDFSDEQKQMRDQARKFLAEKCSPKAVRVVLDGKEPYDRELWKGLAEMGFLGVAIPEEFGGAGAGHLELCVVAEEMGRALAPVPFSSTVYLAAEALLIAGSDAQKKKW